MTLPDSAIESDTHQRQGSSAWHAFRAKHIGASEVSAVLGESDFTTPYELWLQKTGQKAGFKGNFATKRGTDAEPIIRRLYEELYSMRLTTPVLEYRDWPVLSASLDGYSEEFSLVVEFKYPSKEKHAQALRDEVPRTYRAQIQAQLLVAGCDKAHYVSYDGANIAVVTVEADLTEQMRILEACRKFWDHVTTMTPPPGAPVVLESETLEILANRYRHLHGVAAETKREMDMVRERLDTLVEVDRASIYGLFFSRSERLGAVDYASIPELEGVDLAKYRKPAVKMLTIKVQD